MKTLMVTMNNRRSSHLVTSPIEYEELQYYVGVTTAHLQLLWDIAWLKICLHNIVQAILQIGLIVLVKMVCIVFEW